jgi:DNA-binding response OmpR family regulator
VDLAADGARAWELLTKNDYDLAVFDYFLADSKGSELVARLRADPRLQRMLVFAISVGGSEARAAMVSAGADLYLPKPIDLRDVVATLDWLMGGGDAEAAT